MHRRTPLRPTSNSSTPGEVSDGSSPTQMNDPATPDTILSYSRLARMHGIPDGIAAGHDCGALASLSQCVACVLTDFCVFALLAPAVVR